jgi:hypothetical protein
MVVCGAKALDVEHVDDDLDALFVGLAVQTRLRVRDVLCGGPEERERWLTPALRAWLADCRGRLCSLLQENAVLETEAVLGA